MEVGESRGYFNWTTPDDKYYFGDHSEQPDLLEYKGKYYRYGNGGYRKQPLSELVVVDLKGEEARLKKIEIDITNALDKLTNYEKELLGLKPNRIII